MEETKNRKATNSAIILNGMKTVSLWVGTAVFILIYLYQFVRTERLELDWSVEYFLEDLFSYQYELEILAFTLLTIGFFLMLVFQVAGRNKGDRVKAMLTIPAYVVSIFVIRVGLLYIKINASFSLRHPVVSFRQILYSDLFFTQGNQLMPAWLFLIISLLMGSLVILCGHMLPNCAELVAGHSKFSSCTFLLGKVVGLVLKPVTILMDMLFNKFVDWITVKEVPEDEHSEMNVNNEREE